MTNNDSETRQTSRLMGILPIAAIIFVIAFAIWLLFAPTSTTLQDAAKPPAAGGETTGVNRPGVPRPPASTENQADQTTGQGQGGAGSDSTRTTPGPTNPTEGAR